LTISCHLGEWRYNFIVLDLGTGWRWVMTFTPQPPYPRGNRPRYPLDRRLDGPQRWSGRFREEKNFAVSGIKPGQSSPSLKLSGRHRVNAWKSLIRIVDIPADTVISCFLGRRFNWMN
jgi:hypothetical protein